MDRPSVWAPNATDRVDLVLGDERLPMTRGDGGWWHAPRRLTTGTDYAYRLDGGPERPDPRAPRMRHGVHGRSTWFDPAELAWEDTNWAGVPLEGALVYELHVGTFTRDGTLDGAIEHLDHLVRLGVTLVELLPVATFPGRRGWGYDGVDLYAVHEALGGPEALHRFVQACHARGLGVCLDVVHNHLGPSGNYLRDFGPYFTDAYGTPWGDAVNLDGAGSDEVRRFLIDNATWWLRDFHVDALRLDAVHALHDDARALPFLEELSETVDRLAEQLGRPLWLVGESDRNDPRTVLPRARAGHLGGGLGLHGQWADDVHHALHARLTGESDGYYADFTDERALGKVLTTPFFHDGTWSSFRGRTHGQPVDRSRQPGWRFVASLQTHDQVGNRAAGERLSHLVDTGLLACGAALLLTSPYTPLLFMGEEWGASTPWQFFTDYGSVGEAGLAEAVRAGRRSEFAAHGWGGEVPDPESPDTTWASTLDWDEAEEGQHGRLLRWYAALARARRERADLRDPRLDRVVVHEDTGGESIVVERGSHRVLVNLGSEPRPLDPHLPATAGHRELDVILAWEVGMARGDNGSVTVPPRSACVLGPVEAG